MSLWLFFCPVPAGEMRNDLYITLERGEFEKGGKSVARNVEVTVYVLDIDGQILKVNICVRRHSCQSVLEEVQSCRQGLNVILKYFTCYVSVNWCGFKSSPFRCR